MQGDSLRYTDGKVHVFDEGIKLRCTDGKVIGTLLLNVDGIILGIDVGTYLGSLDGSFDGSNDGNIEGLLLVGSLGYTYGKFLGSNEGTKLGCTGGKVSATIFRKVDIITLGIDIGTELGF